MARRRERRANVAGGRGHAHKVKVTPEEEAQLARLAAERRVSVPRLLVESALAEEQGETASERQQLVAELFATGRLLARVANNVNQIAVAVNTAAKVARGGGPVEDGLAAKVDGEVQRLPATHDSLRRVAGRIEESVDAVVAQRMSALVDQEAARLPASREALRRTRARIDASLATSEDG